MQDISSKENFVKGLENYILDNIRSIFSSNYGNVDYSFITNKLENPYLNVNVRTVLKRQSDFHSSVVSSVMVNQSENILKAMDGSFHFPESDSIFMKDFDLKVSKEKFYSYFCVSQIMQANRYRNSSLESANLVVGLLNHFDFESLSFAVYNMSGSMGIIEMIRRDSNFHKLSENALISLEKLKEGYVEGLYRSRERHYSNWFGWTQDKDFDLFMDYVIDNEPEDYDEIYKKLVSANSGRADRYKKLELLKYEYVFLGKSNKSKLKSILFSTKSRGDNRQAKYFAWIRLGYADKKFFRKMRSETSSDVSLYALKALLKYKHLYSNYYDLIAQFNDSRHEEVVRYLVRCGDNQSLLGLVGNPIANKNVIFKKINGEKVDDYEY